jgi:S-adenosylmethionine-dependent methyltransferase
MTMTDYDFDDKIEKWEEWQDALWGKLYYTISRYNIQRHLNDLPKRVLDVGGGNGSDSIYFAGKGYPVTCLEISTEMLARARQSAAKQGVSEKISFHQCNAQDILQRFAGQQFDLILCHLVLEFTKDFHKTLRDICKLIAPGGMLSVIEMNRYSEVYRKIFQVGDLRAALGEVEKKEYLNCWFTKCVPVFSGEEIVDLLRKNGCTLIGHFGIRCVNDYLPNEKKTETEFNNNLEQLERKLTDTYPYYLLARFYQIIAGKK